MLKVTSEPRVRLVLLVDEELREALRVESSMAQQDMSDIVARLLRENLVETLNLLRTRRAAQRPRASKK